MWYILQHFKEKTSQRTYSMISELVGKILCTYDASGIEIRVILTQWGDYGMDYPIVYSIIKLNKFERNY